MSAQTLREALERLLTTYDDVHGGNPGAPGSRERVYYGVGVDLRALLAVHPAERQSAPVDRERIVADFIAQREEYVRVLRQCVDADADYHRWQGHAEARRQLRDKLTAGGGE